jgi:hypothetical protein
MTLEKKFLTTHRAHDYKDLIRRWRKVARAAGLVLKPLIDEAGFTLFHISPRTPRSERSIYLSAGIHGDEPAAPAGLLYWAEQNPTALKELDLLVFPCLNPWGLTHNIRLNHRGRDLNRDFQNRHIPFVREWRKVIGDRRFDLALNLHEDYDGQGVYIYELSQKPPDLAERILKAVAPIIPPDPRRTIDISRAKNGVIRRRIQLADFKDFGLPEAIYLHFHHSDATMTIETPSEFSLYDRTRATAASVQAAIRSLHRDK